MLTFLAVAANSKIIVDSYEESAATSLEKNEQGKTCIKNIILRPKVTFSGAKIPDLELLNKLHEKAHANCIVANSIIANVKVDARS
jgi:organic hydroperoxide reductase OsmC/OhrA